MKLQLLTFPGCPNADAARAAAREAIARISPRPEFEEIDLAAPDTAESLRGWASPTILVNGADLEGQRQQNAGAGCRLYADRSGAPSADQIEQRLRAETTRIEPITQPPRRSLGGASLIGAVIAAIAASACCIVPAVLALVGVSGLGFAAAFETYRPAFLVVAGLLLGLGFFVTYRRTARSRDACGCEQPRAARSGRAMLWIATVLVVGFAAYPYIAGAVATTSRRGSADDIQHAARVQIAIEGMTCRGCASAITDALAKVPGVIRADVSYPDRLATVSYNPGKVAPDAFVAAIDEIGYSAHIASSTAR
jgi:mercuric ion transport protein